MEQPNDSGLPAEGVAAPTEAAPASEPAHDPIQGVKAEMNRKLSNMSEQLAAQSRMFEQILAQQTAQRQAAQAPQGKPLKDLVFEDPEAFVRQVQQQAEAAATRQIEQRVQVSTQTQNAILDVQSKYPEFAQSNSEATTLAIRKADSQPPHLRGTPEGARLAMMEAAAELGLVPASKRQAPQQTRDEFVSPGSAGSSSPRARSTDPKKGIDPTTLAFAEAMGRDINDPKVLEGLASASKRQNWNRYG